MSANVQINVFSHVLNTGSHDAYIRFYYMLGVGSAYAEIWIAVLCR